MGMFDYVKYKANCRKCGAEMTGWQSKDHECVLATIYPQQTERFYDSCKECDTWNEYKVIDADACKFQLVPDEELPDYRRMSNHPYQAI